MAFLNGLGNGFHGSHFPGHNVVRWGFWSRVALFSGLKSVSTVPAGSFAKASLVGAKTVKGPGPCRVSTRSAALTASHQGGVIV